MHPWVVANDRLKHAGWKPQHSNDEALLLATGAPDRSLVPWLAGAGAVTAGVGARHVVADPPSRITPR